MMKKSMKKVFDDANARDVDRLVNQNDAPEVSEKTLNNIKERVYRATGIQRPAKKKILLFRWQSCVAVAACMLLAFVSVFMLTKNSTDANFILDVNPSIEFSIDKNENIKKITALNSDAGAILVGLELEGMPLKDALNAVINAMAKNGYISDTSNSVLVSVDGDDEYCAALRDKIADMVNHAVVSEGISIAVVSHNYASDRSLGELAEEFDISIGKAAIISKIIELDGSYVFEELVHISINDLNIILEKCDRAAISVNTQGDASKKSYIDRDSAIEIALADLGVTLEDVHDVEVEFEYYRSTLVYEVEFDFGANEYEYIINATDSSVIKVDVDADGDDAELPEERISHADALSIAVEDAGVSRKEMSEVSVDLEDDDGRFYYEVEFEVNGVEYEYEIDVRDGTILDKEVDDENAESEEGATSAERIKSAVAVEAALADAELSQEEIFDLSVELEYDDGEYYYEIEFETRDKEYEYKINAVDGTVIDREIS